MQNLFDGEDYHLRNVSPSHRFLPPQPCHSRNGPPHQKNGCKYDHLSRPTLPTTRLIRAPRYTLHMHDSAKKEHGVATRIILLMHLLPKLIVAAMKASCDESVSNCLGRAIINLGHIRTNWMVLLCLGTHFN